MDLMITKLLGFVLVLTRLSAFFLVAPVFSWKTIPARVKVAMVMLISVFFSSVVSFAIDPKEISAIEAIMLISNEAIYGFALGLIVILLFSAVKLSGRIIERQMGFAMAQTLDPLSGETAQPVSILIDMIFVLLFLSANGHHLLLLSISESYQAFPAGTIPTIPLLLSGVVKAGSTMLILCLRLSAPILSAFLLLLAVLAVFARVMPDMNIMFISMPLRVGMGLMMIGMFLPFVNEYVAGFAGWMSKMLPL